MERDNFLSIGAGNVIRERLFELSDYYTVPVCEECGLLAVANPEKHKYLCRACRGKNVCLVEMPYATKLLEQELYAVGIAMRINVKKD